MSAQHRKLNKEDAVEDFKQQPRCARQLHYSRGTTGWECGYDGLEQALWVHRSEDEMTETVCKLLEKENVALNRPRKESRLLQRGIQPQETAAPNRPRAQESVPPTSIQPEESAAPNRRRKETGVLQPNIQPEESVALTRRREERTALQPSVHGARGAKSQGTKGTQEFRTNFVTSLDVMEVTMASEQTKARGKKNTVREKKGLDVLAHVCRCACTSTGEYVTIPTGATTGYMLTGSVC